MFLPSLLKCVKHVQALILHTVMPIGTFLEAVSWQQAGRQGSECLAKGKKVR